MIKRFLKPGTLFINFFKNLKFRQKLILSYLIITIIPILVLGIYSFEQSKQYVINEAERSLQESVRQVALNINYKIINYNAEIKYIAYNNQIVQILDKENPGSYEKYVDMVEVLDPLFSTILNLNDINITIYTADRNVSQRQYSLLSIEAAKDMPWYSKAMSDYQIHWITENKVINGFCRFIEPNWSNQKNLLKVTINQDGVFQTELKSIQNYMVSITDDSGNVLYSANHGNNEDYQALASQKADASGKIVSKSGVQLIAVSSPITETNWNLRYIVPLSALNVDNGRIIEATIIIIIGCMMTLALLTWLFSNTFVKRIENLNRKMKIVEDGNLSIAIASNSRDEIGELTNRCGAMLRNINSLIDEEYNTKIMLQDLKFKALQAQINPHFLYNTLSLINWKAIRAGVMEISDITNNLSEFYRTVLNKGNNIILVSDEIENIKCYIGIQLILHDNSFDVEYDIEEEILACRVINLVLQPIVENAIEHGLETQEGIRGKLAIIGRSDGNRIEFRVVDNGKGFLRGEFEELLKKNTKGYGLKNVHDRIQSSYGDLYGLLLDQKFSEGTCVVIRLPFIN